MTDSTKVILKITKSVLKWIVEEGLRLVDAGIGGYDEEQGFGVGMIDEVGIDTPAYHYMSSLIQYVRTVVAILEKQD